MTRVHLLRCGAALVALAVVSAGASADEPKDEKRPAILDVKPLKARDGDDELQKLLIERFNVAVTELQGRYQEFVNGRATLESFGEVARRLVNAELEVRTQSADQITALERYVDLMRHIEKRVEERQKAGVGTAAEVAQARYARLDAEISLLRAKRTADPVKPK